MSKQFLRMFRADEVSEEAGTPIRYTIATEGIKRDGLNLVMSGARVENYLRNPIVTWVHDFMGHRLPIGRAALIMDMNQIDAEITFDQEDEFARQVESKYRRGYLNAVSVSWDPLRMNGRDVEEWEFLDIAAVPLPGDPEALIKRQYEALGELMGEHGESAGSGEVAQGEWDEMAAEMVAVFLPAPDDGDDRERRYRALLPRYRKAGKVAPEFLSDEELKGLDSRTIANHFLEGEWGLVFPGINSGATEARKGAVLSTRNLEDLSQAVELIRGVMERARKEETSPQPSPDTPSGGRGDGEGEVPEEEPARALETILSNLRKLEV